MQLFEASQSSALAGQAAAALLHKVQPTVAAELPLASPEALVGPVAHGGGPAAAGREQQAQHAAVLRNGSVLAVPQRCVAEGEEQVQQGLQCGLPHDHIPAMQALHQQADDVGQAVRYQRVVVYGHPP